MVQFQSFFYCPVKVIFGLSKFQSFFKWSSFSHFWAVDPVPVIFLLDHFQSFSADPVSVIFLLLIPKFKTFLCLLISAIDYIQFLVQQKKKQEDELDSLRKEVMALKIMKAWVLTQINIYHPSCVLTLWKCDVGICSKMYAKKTFKTQNYR